MGENSVTGVGGGSEYMYLGLSQLIGPRWDQEKEDQFNKMKAAVRTLIYLNAVSFALTVAGLVFGVLYAYIRYVK